MIEADTILEKLRPLHVHVGKTGHILSVGRGFAKIGSTDLVSQRFLEVFELLRPAKVRTLSELHAFADNRIRLRLRDEPDIVLRGSLIDDEAGGLIADLSFGIAVIDAVRRFDLTAQDFAESDLAVELLFLQEAKSTAMAASFSLNTRLDGARLAAETQAATDGLTGLHNRRALDSAMSRLGQSQTQYAMLHLDLDLFKQVNDTLGHAVGDAVLKRVAVIMRRHTRKDDLIVRAGGDEFVIVCPGLFDHTRLGDLARKLIEDISKPMKIEGSDVAISASVGIALSADASLATPNDIAERADIALYAAKRSGRGRCVFWKPDLGDSVDALNASHIAHR